MKHIINRNENLVNYITSSTSAINESYQVPTVDTESLSFKIKNNVLITFSLQDIIVPETSQKKEKEELT
ncbi:MAG: hypothetical protein WC879_15240 [Melioribacteraceae bacterium]